jgi:hypothetical protein
MNLKIIPLILVDRRGSGIKTRKAIGRDRSSGIYLLLYFVRRLGSFDFRLILCLRNYKVP